MRVSSGVKPKFPESDRNDRLTTSTSVKLTKRCTAC